MTEIKKLVKYIVGKLPVRLRCLITSARMLNNVMIGTGSYIHPSVHILGKDHIRIGENSCVSEGCWLNINQRLASKISIEIGNNCFIGKHNFLTSGDRITIGDYTLTTYGCKFIGSTHKVGDPEIPYLIAGTTTHEQIVIGVNCFFGAGATVLGNVMVGHGSVVGSEALVLNDIPPFSVAVGNPAIVVKRYSFTQKKWMPISEMQTADEVGMPTEEEYLMQLKAKFPKVNIPWIAAGKSMGDL
jgi:acetyltransferase-like isoleucine patch superfamily enzyme